MTPSPILPARRRSAMRSGSAIASATPMRSPAYTSCAFGRSPGSRSRPPPQQPSRSLVVALSPAGLGPRRRIVFRPVRTRIGSPAEAHSGLPPGRSPPWTSCSSIGDRDARFSCLLVPACSVACGSAPASLAGLDHASVCPLRPLHALRPARSSELGERRRRVPCSAVDCHLPCRSARRLQSRAQRLRSGAEQLSRYHNRADERQPDLWSDTDPPF